MLCQTCRRMYGCTGELAVDLAGACMGACKELCVSPHRISAAAQFRKIIRHDGSGIQLSIEEAGG